MQQELFDKAAEDAKKLPDKTSNDDKLKLYGLYKQGTVGDVNTGTPRPTSLPSIYFATSVKVTSVLTNVCDAVQESLASGTPRVSRAEKLPLSAACGIWCISMSKPKSPVLHRPRQVGRMGEAEGWVMKGFPAGCGLVCAKP